MRRSSSRRLRSAELDADDGEQVLAPERAEADDLVDAVDELGLEGVERVAPQVGGHDQHGVGEVDRAALAVGEAPVVEHLQQDVEHVRVRLLDLVEQHDRVRAPPDRLGELAALLVADVTGRGADQAGNVVFLLVLAHVDADHRPLVVEEHLGEGLGELGLADARSGRGTGTSRSAGSGPTARPGCAGWRSRRPVTASSWPIDALVQQVLELDELADLAFHEARDRARPSPG